MDGREDAHRHFVRILIRDALVHVEQVAVALFNGLAAQSLDGRGEIEIDAQTAFRRRRGLRRRPFGVARGHVARHQVSKARISPLEVVIAIGFRNLIRAAFVALLLRHPDAAVIAQRLAHQRQLRLILARDRDAGRVDLREAGIGKECSAFMRAPDGGNVGALGVCRKIEDVAVAAGGENHSISDMGIDFTCDQVAGDDAARSCRPPRSGPAFRCADTSLHVPA